jgi:hypothetical protein
MADLIHFEVSTLFQLWFVEGQVTDDNIHGIKTAVNQQVSIKNVAQQMTAKSYA